MTKSWIPQRKTVNAIEDFFNLLPLPGAALAGSRSGSAANDSGSDAGMTQEDSASFKKKLIAMSLLYDVPFAYLVPSENMLRLHEIGFFWLDPNWVRTFLDGACSIGRSASIDYACDTVFLKTIFNEAISQNVNVRRSLQKKPSLLGIPEDTPCTGFLLRSPLVGNWRGLEFMAYGDADMKMSLTALRLETLSSEILLGLYSGEIARLDIKEPPEGFHYGFTRASDGTMSKRLRTLDTGTLCDENKRIPVTERTNRVVNFSAAAAQIKNALFPGSGANPDSAHIALEMIQNPYMLSITRGVKTEASHMEKNKLEES